MLQHQGGGHALGMQTRRPGTAHFLQRIVLVGAHFKGCLLLVGDKRRRMFAFCVSLGVGVSDREKTPQRRGVWTWSRTMSPTEPNTPPTGPNTHPMDPMHPHKCPVVLRLN